ncbi:hypothetical protein [Terriglobus tenax]|uniref:hypothetical protein n=1 Tax=Terriglobus tenax TaxID=1111115 RepID=UPI0021DFD977|nr:hypothetical protein [Terriglobus tenax]
MNAVQGRSVVIVAYRPKPGKEEDLLQLTREHLPLLRTEGLATDREAVVCRAADGTLLEVFEWEAGAIEKAHANPRVMALWERYWACCEVVPLNQLPESSQMFAGFAPVAL